MNKILHSFAIGSLLLSSQPLFSQSTLCTGILDTPVISIGFGSGTPLYDNVSVSNFGFSTTYTEWNKPQTNDDYYSIVNTIPNDFQINGTAVWLSGQDHTPGDVNGYMMLVNGTQNLREFYRDTVTGLDTSVTYEFSAWVANIFKPANAFTPAVASTPPSIRFDLRDLFGNTLYSINTGNISTHPTLNWVKYGITFHAPAQKFILVMVSTALAGTGNDLVIDDIALASCTPIVTGIENELLQPTPKTLVRIYTPLGQAVKPEEVTKGIYIYQYSDGSTRKVMKVE